MQKRTIMNTLQKGQGLILFPTFSPRTEWMFLKNQWVTKQGESTSILCIICLTAYPMAFNYGKASPVLSEKNLALLSHALREKTAAYVCLLSRWKISFGHPTTPTWHEYIYCLIILRLCNPFMYFFKNFLESLLLLLSEEEVYHGKCEKNGILPKSTYATYICSSTYLPHRLPALCQQSLVVELPQAERLISLPSAKFLRCRENVCALCCNSHCAQKKKRSILYFLHSSDINVLANRCCSQSSGTFS